MKPNAKRRLSLDLSHSQAESKGTPFERPLVRLLRPSGVLLFAFGVVALLLWCPWSLLAAVVSLGLLMNVAAATGTRIKANPLTDHAGLTKGFALSLGEEVITLDFGKTWPQVDRYKWCARGLVSEPHHFRVQPDGTVEINVERIRPDDPASVERLELEINKPGVMMAFKPPPEPLPAASLYVSGPAGAKKTQFKVKLDRLGHLVIEHGHGSERDQTGLRGIAALIGNGLMRKPDSFRVDAMQRYVEIDGVTYDCTEQGAQRLEQVLNSRYCPSQSSDKQIAIEIKENLASTTGFDIHFMTLHGGIPFHVKGHLTQELLDILQDQQRCELLKPEIQMRLAPPYLLIRRRRDDMGEEKIPGIPDINYNQINAIQLQQILNHPLLRKSGGEETGGILPGIEERPLNVKEIKVVRSPANRALLWLECVMTDGSVREAKALTHHNVADFQQRGFFRSELDVCLSFDHRRLSFLKKATRHEDSIALDADSPDSVLAEASRMLTAALKPPVRAIQKSAAEVAKPIRKTRAAAPPKQTPPAQEAAKPETDPAISALFSENDPVRINTEIFRRMSEWFGIPAQEACLSLDRIFENRRFEIINFEGEEINDFMELRSEYFYGFYLSHVNEKKVLLVYACNGEHLEWGTEKCMLQPSMRAERVEYRGRALLGFAQDEKDEFVFIVEKLFKEWLKPHEHRYTEENVHFITVADYAAAQDRYKLIWPERKAAASRKADLHGHLGYGDCTVFDGERRRAKYD